MTFIAEWYDKLACIEKPFRLMFYTSDNSLEIVDLKSKKQHLKRIRIDSLTYEDFYVGNTLDIYGRRFKIVEFADSFTKEQLFSKKERTFAMIKPDAYQHMGKIIDIILQQPGFSISRVLMLRLNEEMVAQIYPDHSLKAYFRELTRFLTSDVILGMEIVGENSIEKLKALAGQPSPLGMMSGK